MFRAGFHARDTTFARCNRVQDELAVRSPLDATITRITAMTRRNAPKNPDEAAAQLLQTKARNDITVREIAQVAGVNGSSTRCVLSAAAFCTLVSDEGDDG